MRFGRKSSGIRFLPLALVILSEGFCAKRKKLQSKDLVSNDARGLAPRYNPFMEAGELLKQALALSDKERAELASSLIDSLDTTIDPDTELAWQEEIARRLSDVESGKVKTIPWEEVRRKGRAVWDGR